jgi:glycosyltransferase involved in cell wall biosynthesis
MSNAAEHSRGAGWPKVSFGMIVLNGEPFLLPNLRALYPFAHEIIVAEGASPKAAHAATPDGHSTDATLAVLREFQKNEDPQGKLKVVVAEDEGHPSGFWPGEKSQQSQAYAKRITGDWLWQIDVDEFYHPEDIDAILRYLAAHPDVTCVTFPAYHFWGGFDYVVEGGFMWHPRYQGEPYGRYRRILKWGRDWHYATHRPPTVFDSELNDVTRRRLVNAARIVGRDRVMFHYFMTDTRTILRKAKYYEALRPEVFRNREATCAAVLEGLNWESALRIFDQYGTWNWLEKFVGRHPPAIESLLRSTPSLTNHAIPPEKIDRVLEDRRYRRARWRLALIERLKSHWRAAKYEGVMAILSALRSLPPQLARLLPGRLRKHTNRLSTLDPSEREYFERLQRLGKEGAFGS